MNNLNHNLKGLFISSSVDPYVEEFYDNTKTISKQLQKIGIPAYRFHASGHNTSFQFAGGADTDLCLRLRKKGFWFV